MNQPASQIIDPREAKDQSTTDGPATTIGGCRYNTDLSQYSYPSPLAGYENLDPLPNTKSPVDGKSYVNPQTGVLSDAYQRFVDPISNDGPLPGFDIHVYFNPVMAPPTATATSVFGWYLTSARLADERRNQDNPEQTKFAQELWERIRREFPELRIYRIWHEPCGPHAAGMFEVNLFTPAQFGAFVSWLVINRGPLSALVHPNTNDELRDHIQRYAWLGPEVPLNMAVFRLRGTTS